jgi:hypothetical protein
MRTGKSNPVTKGGQAKGGQSRLGATSLSASRLGGASDVGDEKYVLAPPEYPTGRSPRCRRWWHRRQQLPQPHGGAVDSLPGGNFRLPDKHRDFSHVTIFRIVPTDQLRFRRIGVRQGCQRPGKVHMFRDPNRQPLRAAASFEQPNIRKGFIRAEVDRICRAHFLLSKSINPGIDDNALQPGDRKNHLAGIVNGKLVGAAEEGHVSFDHKRFKVFAVRGAPATVLARYKPSDGRLDGKKPIDVGSMPTDATTMLKCVHGR